METRTRAAAKAIRAIHAQQRARTEGRCAVRGGLSTCLVAAMLSASCASMSPQIFSDDMVGTRAAPDAPTPSDLPPLRASDPITVTDAKAGATQAMQRYNAAVQEMSGLTPRLGVGLIALSALALLKSISHPNGSDIAGVGVVGGATYLYGTTVISKPRQLTYIAGSRALGCAIAASEPYDVAAATQNAWRVQRTQVDHDADTLRATLGLHAGLATDRSVTTPLKATPAGCNAASRPACVVPPAATPDERKRIEDNCLFAQADFARRCAVAPARTRTEAADPALVAAIAQARAELLAAESLSAQVATLLGKLRMAGSDLRWQSQQIQLRVSEEVLKTEPDLASILASTRGLRGAAFTLTGADAFKPASGRPEGARLDDRATARVLDADAQQALRKAIQDIEQDTATLKASRLALASEIVPVVEAIRGLRTTLQQCEVTVPGVTLQVLPDVDEIRMAAGESQSFYVSGGTGIPSGRVVSNDGRMAGTLERALDRQGRLSFVYVAPAKGTGPNGDSLLFTDQPEQARRTVVVKAAESALKRVDEAEISAAERARLGLGATASDTELRRAIAACQGRVVKPELATGQWDANAREAVAAGKCDNIAKKG